MSDGDSKLMFADEGILQHRIGVALDDIVTEEEISPHPGISDPFVAIGFIIGILGAVFYISSTREE